MKRLNKKTKALIFFSLLFFTFSFVLAQEVNYFPIPRFPIAPTSGAPLPIFVKYLFNFGVMIGGVIAFAVLIWAGICYLTSSGNVEKIGEAKEKARNAFIGLLILIFSYLIIVTINPQLSILSEEVEGTGNFIYLIDTKGKKYLVTGNEPDVNYPDIRYIEFHTDEDTPFQDTAFKYGNPNYFIPDIFIFPEKDYQGIPLDCCIMDVVGCVASPPGQHKRAEFLGWPMDVKSVAIPKIPREGAKFFSVSSIVGLWCIWKYIKNSPHLLSSAPNFAFLDPPFDNKTTYIEILGSNYVIVCDKPGYTGACTLITKSTELYVPPKPFVNATASVFLSANLWDYDNYPPIATYTISSAILLKSQPSPSCQVAFYDRTNCQGNELVFPFWGNLGDGTSTAGIVLFTTSTPQFATGTPLFENVLSIKIKSGTCGVLLCTNGPPAIPSPTSPTGVRASTTTDAGICQFFRKPDNGSACIPTLVGSAVYESKLEDPAPGYQTKKVRWIRIVPYERIEE